MSSQHEGILIVGAPRSGTTLLRRLLDAHPRIACPGETNLFSACAKFLDRERIAEGVELGVLSGLSFAGVDEETVIERLREFAFAFLREYASRQGKARWAEKTAFNAFYLDAIERLCGDHVHFVCIQRHGLDVACSLQELCDKNGGYLSELHAYINRYPRTIEAFAHVWVDLTESIRSLVERCPENTTLIRYEDLIADPPAVMEGVLGAVGESFHPDVISKALERKEGVGLGDWKTYEKSRFDRQSIDRWKSLSRASLGGLAKIVNPMLEACGYEPLIEEGEVDSDEARRRYELGLLINSMKREN